jgi:hypothetical protein
MEGPPMRRSQTKTIRKNRKTDRLSAEAVRRGAEIRALIRRGDAAHKRIAAARKQCIDLILKTGRKLIAAKDALDHGQFKKMVERKLPIDISTAQLYMRIVRDPDLVKAEHVRLLPPHVGSLAELTRVPRAEREQAFASGRINPTMTRKEARLVRIETSSYSVPLDAPGVKKLPGYTVSLDAPTLIRPVYKAAEPTAVTAVTPMYKAADAPSSRVLASLAIFERSGADLAMAIERGEFRVDAVFAGRVRAVTDPLLTAIADTDRLLTALADDEPHSTH